jgi:hypothetical protein
MLHFVPGQATERFPHGFRVVGFLGKLALDLCGQLFDLETFEQVLAHGDLPQTGFVITEKHA